MKLISEPSALKHFYDYLRWMQVLSCCLQVAIQLDTSALLYTECLGMLDRFCFGFFSPCFFSGVLTISKSFVSLK